MCQKCVRKVSYSSEEEHFTKILSYGLGEQGKASTFRRKMEFSELGLMTMADGLAKKMASMCKVSMCRRWGSKRGRTGGASRYWSGVSSDLHAHGRGLLSRVF